MNKIIEWNNPILRKILKGVLAVTSGSLIMKISIFFFNIVLVRYSIYSSASDLSKIFTFGFAWCSFLYFSSSKYIAKIVLVDKESLLKNIKLINGLILLMTPILSLLVFFTFKDENIYFILNLIVFSVAMAYFDFYINIANAIGLNKLAAINQTVMGVGIFFVSMLLIYDFIFFQKIILFFLILLSILLSFFMYSFLCNFEEKDRNFYFDRNFFNQYRSLIYFSSPTLIGAIFVNPLILWSVNSILKISDKDFIVFVACLNVLGLTMLFPGQINTATFNILAKGLKNKNINILVFFASIMSALFSIIFMNIIFPYLSFIYGYKINEMIQSVFWITMCALPYVCCQFISSKLFLMKKPWQDAISNLFFGFSFVGGCYWISFHHYSLYLISVLLFISYSIRMLFLASRLYLLRKFIN